MTYASVVKQFDRIGARLIVSQAVDPTRRMARAANGLALAGRPYDLDVRRDRRHGEHYLLRVSPAAGAEFRVLQANTPARHLLLHALSAADTRGERFLCGHDERHWFVAGIPAAVTTVTDARRALLPRELQDATFTADELSRRHGKKFKRQGEWFFVPATVDQLREIGDRPILHGEKLQRGTRASKPHVVSELVRFGGQQVVLFGGKEYTPAAWDKFVADGGGRVSGRADRRVKDAMVFVRGSVRHSDHATLILPDWYRVFMNGEAFSVNMSFYD